MSTKVWTFTEEDEQAALFSWVRQLRETYPLLKLLHHSPNEGKRAPRKAKRLGIRSGFPDLILPVPSADQKHIGLAIELKRGDNRPTENQRWWLEQLQAQGWRAEVHTSRQPGDWAQTALVICEHLGLPEEVRRWLT